MSRVLMLVGVYRADWQDERFQADIVPVVAGVVDETVWEHETEAETDARWSACKAAWDPSGMDYEWREVWVRLDVPGLRAPFEIPEAASVADSPASSTNQPPTEGTDR